MSVHNSNMWAYDPSSRYDRNGYQSFTRPPFEPALYRGFGCNEAFPHGGIPYATPPQSFPHFTPNKTTNFTPGPQYPSSNRLLMSPFEHNQSTIKSNVTSGTAPYHSLLESPTHGSEYAIFPSDRLPPSTISPPLSMISTPDQYYSQAYWPPGFALPTSEDCRAPSVEGSDMHDGELYDRPYAQLIYDALMQAPGHRMLLRDIYEWFVRNTKKPRESGTNGWQNSIRHNLSMNKAFENDKDDPAAGRGARKANSVWVLTDAAVRDGVQSTTRYRKNNFSKKGNRGRIPALQRQRSGARGGQAARRAAKMKQSQTDLHEAQSFQVKHELSPVFTYKGESTTTTTEHWPSYDSYSPITPTPGQYFDSQYILPEQSHFENVETGGMKYEAESLFDEERQLRQLLLQEMPEDNLEHFVMI